MINCPHCRKSFGGPAREGGFRMRLGIVILDPETGDVHGPCPHCKEDVTIATGADMKKALIPAVGRSSRRRLVLSIQPVPHDS